MPFGCCCDPVECLPQQGTPFLTRQPDMDTWSGRPMSRAGILGDLRGVAQDEVGGDRGNEVRAVESRFQIEAFAVAKALFEPAHDGDIRPAEPVCRLPVVADSEQPRCRRLVQQCLQQPCPARRDVLKLVDKDVAKRAVVATGLHMVHCSVDHVMKIDLPRTRERFLVALEHRAEHRQERFGPQAVRNACGATGHFRGLQPAALVMLEKGREETDERLDPAPAVPSH